MLRHALTHNIPQLHLSSIFYFILVLSMGFGITSTIKVPWCLISHATCQITLDRYHKLYTMCVSTVNVDGYTKL